MYYAFPLYFLLPAINYDSQGRVWDKLTIWFQHWLFGNSYASAQKAFFKSPQNDFELLSNAIISLPFGNVEKQKVS